MTEAPVTPPGVTEAPLPLRRHHVLCALGFQGHGYSDLFTANMARIVEGRLRAEGGAEVPLAITEGADAICGPCPARRGTGCEKNDKILALDVAHGAALRIAPGDRLSWGEALDRVRAHVRPGDLSVLCAGCQWLSLGLCEAALRRLHRQDPAT